MNISEILVIILVAFLVIKPKEFPAIVRHIGRFIYHLNHLSDSAQKTIENELKLEQLRKNEEKADEAEKKHE